MKKDELLERLDNLSVPRSAYCLEGGLTSETFCVGYDNENMKWEFYYSERGNKNSLMTFITPEEAYNYLYLVLKKEMSKNYF